ncbi:hypothetical protein EVA_11220 [gut metagenome]|uniref:Uncharacterized protein n=1 Tax=gut metagenome TaxID=749906 RepID=J9G1F7_9ZZZZ
MEIRPFASSAASSLRYAPPLSSTFWNAISSMLPLSSSS